MSGGAAAAWVARAGGVRLGVLGWPVAHSLSPAMQSAGLAALGLADWTYQALPVPPELLGETVRALGGAGFRGVNVTIPHKAAALELADGTSAAARAIGAANTLTFEAGGILAENTDAPGLLAALGSSVEGMRALVLGAGGSARAAVWALLGAGAAEVMVRNRTHARAEDLARALGASAVREAHPADLLVNCTSVGLAPGLGEQEVLGALELDEGLLASYGTVVDLVYAPAGTVLLGIAARHGSRTVDGLELLLAQGALSLEIWTGLKAPREAMREALRARAAW